MSLCLYLLVIFYKYSIGEPRHDSSSCHVQPSVTGKPALIHPANTQSIQIISCFFVLLKIIKPFVSNQKTPG